MPPKGKAPAVVAPSSASTAFRQPIVSPDRDDEDTPLGPLSGPSIAVAVVQTL
jgi:hypothetical protein